MGGHGRQEVLRCGDMKKLIKKRKTEDETPVYYVCIANSYNIIKQAHVATGHGGHGRMKTHLWPKQANITKEPLEMFMSYYITCQEKKKSLKTTGVVVKPILSSEFNSCGQVDLVDKQVFPQAQWIMVYQCHLTKFVILQQRASNRAAA